MSIFDQIKNGVAAVGGRVLRGLDLLRDVPAAAPVPAVTPAVLPAAVARNPFRPREILTSDFVAGESWRSNEWFRLAAFEVPENTDWQIGAGDYWSLYLPQVQRANGQNLGAPANRSITVSNLQQTKLATSWSGPANYHPEVAVWAVVSGTWTRCSIVSINYGTGAVTFVEPAGVANSANQIEIYHIGKQGEFRIRLQRALGDKDTSIAGQVNNSLLAVHSIDQIDAREGLRWPVTTLMAQKQTLLVEVKATVELVWNARSADITLIQLPAKVRDLRVFDDQGLSRLREISARSGV